MGSKTFAAAALKEMKKRLTTSY